MGGRGARGRGKGTGKGGAHRLPLALALLLLCVATALLLIPSGWAVLANRVLTGIAFSIGTTAFYTLTVEAAPAARGSEVQGYMTLRIGLGPPIAVAVYHGLSRGSAAPSERLAGLAVAVAVVANGQRRLLPGDGQRVSPARAGAPLLVADAVPSGRRGGGPAGLPGPGGGLRPVLRRVGRGAPERGR
jgi:MFS family permease